MESARDEFAALGCSILVVSQAQSAVLTRYLERQSWHVAIVSDPDRIAYRAFGLERTGWSAFFRPKVLWGYFRGLFKGYGVKKPYEGEDLLQLGGDFVLDRSGRVVFAYPSADPTDRPAMSAIVEAIRGASQ